MAYIRGSDYSEVLGGTGNSDIILALGGNDTIWGSDGVDFIDGGAGSDTIDYSGQTNGLAIVLQGSQVALVEGGGIISDRLVNIENINGGSGDDYFVGDDNDNTFRGNEGHDYFVASWGSDTYYGDGGYDMVDYSDIRTALVITPTGKGYSTTSAFGQAYDQLWSIENIIGGTLNDVIRGDGANNYFRGITGDDRLLGGAGGDVLDGGRGNDKLTGGRDADIFVFAKGDGRDLITDFDATGSDHDVIDLTALNLTDCLCDDVHQNGRDIVIDLHGGNTVTLKNVALADLDASDFLF